jgi:hypothetical protein
MRRTERQVVRLRGGRILGVLTFVALSTFAAPAFGQTPGDPAVTAQGARIEPSAMQIVRWSRVGSGLEAIVSLPAVLSGRTVTEASFAVTAGAESVPFTVARLAADQLDIALVVTSFGAPTAQPSDDAIRGAIVEFVAALPPGGRVAVVGDDPPRSLSSLTGDRAALSLALSTRGVAAAAIDPALRLGADAVVGARRPIVVMIGPGLPVAGTVPTWWPDAVPLYAARAEPTERSTGQFVRNRTGGFATTTPAASIVTALDAVATDLLGQYRITIANVAASIDDLVLRVRVADVDSQATIVLAPGSTRDSPNAAATLPEASPAVVSDLPDAASEGSDPPWTAVIAAVLVVALLAGAAVVARRRDVVAGAVDRRPSPAPDPGAPAPPAEITVVLSARDPAGPEQHAGTDLRQVVRTPADALREVVRHRATTLVIEAGTDDPWPLVHAVAHHDRASGGHTRIVQVSATGTLIDLTNADAR